MGIPLPLIRGYPTGNYVEQDNVATVESLIAKFTVPRGKVFRSYAGKDISRVINLGYAQTVSCAGDHALFATTFPIARIPMIDDSAPADGLNQLVALKADGTARTITQVDDHIDSPSLGQIKCSDETAADHQVCYNPYADGEVAIYLMAPGSAGDFKKLVFRKSVAQLHAENQERDGRFTFGIDLPQNFSIGVFLRATWVVAFNSGATAGAVDLGFTRIQLPIELLDLREIEEKGEPSPGYNAAQRAIAYIAGFSVQ